MTAARAVAGLLLALVWSATGAEEAAPTAPAVAGEPYKLVRSLQALQDQIALGSREAESAQRALLIPMAKQMLAADPSVWEEPRNARSAVIYVLSGGQPEILRRLLEIGERAPIERRLLKGTLAYATGQHELAWRLVSELDARALAPSLGGHLALAQGSLAIRQDPASADRYLADARLLMPGTLVEEAALRRQLAVSSAQGELEAFERLAKLYLRRYGRSVFAENLLTDLPRLWLDFAHPDAGESVAGLEHILDGVSEEQRREVMLEITRGALLSGELTMARSMAGRAQALVEGDEEAGLRARLYLSAAEVGAEPDAGSVEWLSGVDPARLSQSDGELREAALAVAREVRQQPPEAPASAEPEAATGLTAEVIAKGREALAAADDLLRRTSR